MQLHAMYLQYHNVKLLSLQEKMFKISCPNVLPFFRKHKSKINLGRKNESQGGATKETDQDDRHHHSVHPVLPHGTLRDRLSAQSIQTVWPSTAVVPPCQSQLAGYRLCDLLAPNRSQSEYQSAAVSSAKRPHSWHCNGCQTSSPCSQEICFWYYFTMSSHIWILSLRLIVVLQVQVPSLSTQRCEQNFSEPLEKRELKVFIFHVI